MDSKIKDVPLPAWVKRAEGTQKQIGSKSKPQEVEVSSPRGVGAARPQKFKTVKVES